MPLDRVVGGIVEPRRNAYVQWKIPEFSEISFKEDNYLESPPFYLLNRCWCLRFYPQGDSQSIGWFAVYLTEKEPTSPCVLTFMIRLKFLQEDIKRGPETHTFDENDCSYGWAKIFKASEICNPQRSPYDMIISCNVMADPPSLNRPAFQTWYSNTYFLTKSCEVINLNKQNSNATIEVQGHEFKVHRIVLETCSDVLSTMLQHMTDNESLIDIDDCDPDIFDTVIQFMYSDDELLLSSCNVNKLYVLADKYSISRLKSHCTEFMENNMSVDTAYDVLILAEKHNDPDLKMLAEEFLMDNIDTILPTEKWRSLMIENTSLATEIITKLVKFYKSKEK